MFGVFYMRQIEVRDTESLIPYANNSRTHSNAQVSQVAASIKEFGFTNPVLIDEQGGIIAGHGRVMAAKKLGLAEVPCVVLDGLSEAQKKAYIIADNKLALNSGWDADMLKVEMERLGELGFDLSLTGFDDIELGELFGEPEQIEGLTDEDEVPEAPETPVSVLGDVWLLGNHRLMCGDSTSIDAVERLMAGKRADFCFTSPPYNAAIKSAQMHSKAPKSGAGGLYVGGYSDDKSSTEYIQFNSDIISALSAVAGENFTCCYNINYNKNSPSEYIDVIHAAKQSIPLVETIVWEKAMAVSLQGDNLTRIFEFVFVLCKGKFKINKNRTDCLKNLWKISNIGANHESHKACFPIKLVEEGIKNFAPHGAVIVEPFGGSGTTLIAAEKLGCSAFLMELDPKYCDVIVRRWQEFTGKQATLESSGATFEQVAADRKT
jgi:DNA modification methylase